MRWWLNWAGHVAKAAYRASKGSGSHPRDPVLAAWFGGDNTLSGQNVNADTALRVATVYACVRVLSETIATLPLIVFERTETGKRRATEHPLHALLHDRPNETQTSFEWRETMVAHAALRGDAFSEIQMRNDGRIVGLAPLHPDRVRPFMSQGRLAFEYFPIEGARRILLPDEVLRLPMLSPDGVKSLSPIGLHREAVGIAMASQRYLAAFYGNNAAPKGALEVPPELNDEAVEVLRDSFERRHRGPENAGRLAILDGGMKWQSIGISNEDAQYLQLQQFQVTDIARIFRVPPHKIADLSKATFSNIEQQSIEFVSDTILPWVRRWENRLNLSLLSEVDRRRYFIAFELKGLLRGDSKARSDFYRQLFFTGSLSPNDIRTLEDMDRIEAAGADSYYIQSAMIPLDMAGENVRARATEQIQERSDDSHEGR